MPERTRMVGGNIECVVTTGRRVSGDHGIVLEQRVQPPLDPIWEMNGHGLRRVARCNVRILVATWLGTVIVVRDHPHDYLDFACLNKNAWHTSHPMDLPARQSVDAGRIHAGAHSYPVWRWDQEPGSVIRIRGTPDKESIDASATPCGWHAAPPIRGRLVFWQGTHKEG